LEFGSAVAAFLSRENSQQAPSSEGRRQSALPHSKGGLRPQMSKLEYGGIKAAAVPFW